MDLHGSLKKISLFGQVIHDETPYWTTCFTFINSSSLTLETKTWKLNEYLAVVYQITYTLICKLSTFIVEVCGGNLFVLLSLRIGKGKCNLLILMFLDFYLYSNLRCAFQHFIREVIGNLKDRLDELYEVCHVSDRKSVV